MDAFSDEFFDWRERQNYSSEKVVTVHANVFVRVIVKNNDLMEDNFFLECPLVELILLDGEKNQPCKTVICW